MAKLIHFFTWLKAGHIIWSQDVSWSTATPERPFSVDTSLFTHSMVNSALIKIFKRNSSRHHTLSLMIKMDLPPHVKLSGVRMYPALQEHSKEPAVLAHVVSHPPLSVRHSSISMFIKSEGTFFIDFSLSYLHNHCY